MGFRIEETFRVQASVDRVWRYLADPKQVVSCLPGAELTGDEGERVYLGKVKVKVGPVTASYAGRARLTEVNDAERVVRMDAEGREAGGAGSAKLRMMSRVDAHPEGGAAVRVEAEVDVAGKIVQFGRGMIESVSKQLFKDFVGCVRATLESAEPAGPREPSTASAGPSKGGPAQAQARPVALLPLVFRALRATLSGWVARIFGRRRAV